MEVSVLSLTVASAGIDERLSDVAADRYEGDPAAGIVNPRLSDVFGLVIRQDVKYRV